MTYYVFLTNEKNWMKNDEITISSNSIFYDTDKRIPFGGYGLFAPKKSKIIEIYDAPNKQFSFIWKIAKIELHECLPIMDVDFSHFGTLSESEVKTKEKYRFKFEGLEIGEK